MLIETITFDIHDFTNHTDESYLVENTLNNQEWIFTSRKTRNVQFTQTFDFQFASVNRMPVEMAATVAWYDLCDSANELENELCDIDEMTGSYL